MCRLIGLQLLRGGDTNITFIFIVKRIQCCAVPSPKQLSTEKKYVYISMSCHVWAGFQFYVKIWSKKKKERASWWVFLGGCFPLGQESVSVRGTVAWGLFIVLPWNPVTMLIEPFYYVLQSYVRSIVVKKKPHKTRNYMIVTNYWGSVSSMFQSAKFSVHFLRGIPQVFSWIWRR